MKEHNVERSNRRVSARRGLVVAAVTAAALAITGGAVIAANTILGDGPDSGCSTNATLGCARLIDTSVVTDVPTDSPSYHPAPDTTFTGTTAGQDRFRFTAALVEPDAAPPERARITTLAGEVALHNGPVVELEADTGDLHIPTERLDLAGNVRIRTSEGYRMNSEQATLDLQAGSLVAGNAVETTGPLGRIDSGSLTVEPAAESGEARRFSFGNGVRLVYDPPNSG